MAKRVYYRPTILPVEESDDPTIVIGGSQGTSGDDSQFTWDPTIDKDDIDLFWLSFDETELASDIDVNPKDQYISYAEFYSWWNEHRP